MDVIIVLFFSFLKPGVLLHLALPLIEIPLLLNKDQCFAPMQSAYQLPISEMGFNIYVCYQNDIG